MARIGSNTYFSNFNILHIPIPRRDQSLACSSYSDGPLWTHSLLAESEYLTGGMAL
jgi:hypothetical protein